MKRFMPIDYALWAALPMAHTSKIESRIMMILDKSRRRTLPRRIVILALAVGSAALVPLAMLRPVANAQTRPRKTQANPAFGPIRLFPNDTTMQLVGVTGTEVAGSSWWSAFGAPLPVPAFDTAEYRASRQINRAGTKEVSFVFEMPVTIPQGDVSFTLPSSGYASTGISDRSSTRYTLTAPFPLSQTTTSIRVGLASGRWTTAASNVMLSRTVKMQNAPTFSPVTDAGHDSIVTITDHPAVDSSNFDHKFVAIDQQGREHEPSGTSVTGTSAAEQRTLHFPLSSAKVKEVRVETRPYQWVEFKNIALQPIPSTSSTDISAPAQNYQTPWTSQVTRSRWQPHTTYHLAIHIAPGVEGTRPDPPVSGGLVYGLGKVSGFMIAPWKPGKFNILTVKFNYTPIIADKAHPDIIHLLTKERAIASVLEFYSV